MHNWSTLFQFELKKLTKKKLLWITLLLCLLGVGVTVTSGLFGTYYVDGEPVETHYEIFRKDQAYQKALSGRAIDQNLLLEAVDAYRRIPSEAERYTLTEQYQTYARPYSEIINLIRTWTGGEVMELPEIQAWDVSEDALYLARRSLLEKEWQGLLLTEREKEFWQDKEDRLSTPLTYYYYAGYETAMDSFVTVGVLMLLFVAVCLSIVFPDEHAKRTDQLMLSSAKGKTTAYWAKLLAGVTVAVAGSAVMALASLGLCMAIFGAEGFGTPVQIFFYRCSYPLTVGQVCLIAYGILIITAILAGVFVMVLSELLRSGIATLAISTGLIILGGMVSIAPQYRLLAQLWDWLPMTYLSTWNILDQRTLPLFGHCLLSWQVVPVIYILCSVALAIGGKHIFQRYQVSGR